MSHTTAADVQAIISVDATVSSLTPFIDAAISLVTELCADAGYDDARLVLIETWLAAHFYTVRDPRLQSEGAGDASGTYEGQTTRILSSSRYGQHAMLLDTAGALASLNVATDKGSRRTATVTWLGTDLNEDEAE